MPDASGAISNTSRESLYEFVEREQKLDESIGEAQYTVRALKKDRKNLRALITAAGFDLGMFDRTRQMMGVPHEQREAEFRELARNLAWMGMPIGTQSQMFSDEETAVPPEIQVSRVKSAGRSAGKLGRERTANPWPAGSLLAVTWDEEWLFGREEAAQTTVTAAAPPAPKRGPGRPRKAAAPSEPVFAQEPQQPEPEAETQPETTPVLSGLEFDSETEGSA